MFIIIVLLFFVSPILTLPLSFFGIVIDKKNRFIYGIMISLVLAIIAYYWIPEINFDLFRHHLNLEQIRFSSFFEAISNIPPDQDTLAFIISFFIAKLNCDDLLQLFVCFTGYSVIFYILTDYAKRIKVSNSIFALVTLFIILSVGYINFISGLWNMLAMIVFALGIYLEYIKKNNKIFCYILYFIAILLHISLLFPLIIKLVFDFSGRKINLRLISILILLLLLPQTILTLLNQVVDIGIFQQLLNMYNSYFIGSEQFAYLHSGVALIVELIKISIYIIVYILLGRKRENYHNIVLVFLISTGLLMINSGIFMRFMFLVQLLGIPMLFDYFKKQETNQKVFVIIYMIILISGLGFYQYKGIREMNYGNLGEKFSNNIIAIFRKEDANY